IPDEQIMETYFGGVYDVKRLAPGLVMEGGDRTEIRHDCTTLGGNSGSAVVDLNTGKAVGLHFAGLYRVANYAVPATVVRERLAARRRGDPGGQATPRRARAPPPRRDVAARPEGPLPARQGGVPAARRFGRRPGQGGGGGESERRARGPGRPAGQGADGHHQR